MNESLFFLEDVRLFLFVPGQAQNVAPLTIRSHYVRVQPLRLVVQQSVTSLINIRSTHEVRLTNHLFQSFAAMILTKL
jgi:hypothetical protein